MWMGHRYNLLLSRSIQNVYIVQCNFLHTFALFVACQELVHHLFSRFLSVPTFLYIPFCLTCSALPFISPDIGYPLFLDVVCTIKLTFSCIILQPHTIRSSPVFVTRYFKLCAWMESKSQGSYPTSATDKRCCPLMNEKGY